MWLGRRACPQCTVWRSGDEAHPETYMSDTPQCFGNVTYWTAAYGILRDDLRQFFSTRSKEVLYCKKEL